MRFKVTGQNRDTGARQTMEFEAESKAAAERKATQAGMSVHRVEDITDGHVAHAMEPGQGRRRAGGTGRLATLLIILIILVVAAYFLWPYVQRMTGRE